MCGLAGYLAGTASACIRDSESILRRMGDTIRSRGPDSAGYWWDESGISLAHRRLSILDLSPAGHQPMHSASGRYVIAFNGEIYNHLTLRSDLQSQGTAPNWQGHSDTETLLAGFDAWGIKATVERCIGMFAFAVWDKQERLLTLGRDRLGEKPLYYGWQGDGDRAFFLFGSELKALKAHPAFNADIDRDALCLLMRHNCIAAPYSIYRGIHKLKPGSLLSVSLLNRQPALESYWSLTEVAVAGVQSVYQGTDQQAVDELEVLLKSAIKQQMVADVPLGAFLSGGIDSSTIVALMQSQSDRPVKTFTIGFNEAGYNEAVHAKAVANYLGTDHTELYVTPRQAMDVIPELPSLYCEPFSDASQIPTYLVSQLASQHVTVSLSGDAGDELFAGYNRYLMTQQVWRKISYLPSVLRSAVASAIKAVPPKYWNLFLSPLDRFMPASLRNVNAGDKLHKAADILNLHTIDELYLALVTHWQPERVVIGATEPKTLLMGDRPSLYGLNAIERMMALDAITYMPDDILVKVDRAAMGVSLETRVPLLDHRVVQFAWSLPFEHKMRNGVTKWALRQVLYRYVPPELVERPKQGFGVPIDEWLRGPLRDWAESLLSVDRLKSEGYFEYLPIRKKWDEHLSGKRDWQYHLWDVLMFQAWLDEQKAK